MSKLRKIIKGLRKTLKFSISDPSSFKEIGSFNSTGIRVLSLAFIILLLALTLVYFLFGVGIWGDSMSQKDTSIERDKLEQQYEKISLLTKQLEQQELYIRNVKRILKGEVSLDSTDVFSSQNDTLNVLNIEDIDSKFTPEERELASKVKNDMSTQLNSSNELDVMFFISPINGVVSQHFDKKKHPGIDVVGKKDESVKACLSGTVIYAGYTHRDGHVVIINHGDNYLSVYKHNQRILKKTGTKVKTGDPVAIIGNTGENSDGPHLHFELWKDSQPVNPEKFMVFSR